MASSYDVCVIGAGMIGSSAARHILQLDNSLNVILIGPEEVQDLSCMRIHGAHYDEARITRTVEGDMVWAKLSERSVKRYRFLEKESGISFYHEVGCMALGPQNGKFTTEHVEYAINNSHDVSILNYDEMRQSFPYFRFQENDKGVLSRQDAGHINPRKFVEAEKIIALRQGATIVDDTVKSVTFLKPYHRIETDNGRTFFASKVLCATGAFTHCSQLLPECIIPKMRLMPETVILIEVDNKYNQIFEDMPCMMVRGDEGPNGPPNMESYILPPVKYPDGKMFLKIGHGKVVPIDLHNPHDIHEWYMGSHPRHNAVMEEHLYNLARKYFPDLPLDRVKYGYCVTSHTTHGHNYIDMITPTLGVALGGNGKSAKCSDELGHIAARMIIKGHWDYDIPATTFKFVADEKINHMSKL